MKKYLLILLFTPIFTSGQQLATTEDGRRVFLKSDGTYEFLKNDTVVKNEKATIKGTVTYFFNDNYGFKPDTGAKIIIRSTNEEDKTTKIISNYSEAKLFLEIIDQNKKLKKTDDPYPAKRLKDLGVKDEKDLDSLSNLAFKHSLKSETLDNIQVLQADGSGNFSTEIEPGMYEIIVVSKNRKGNTTAEAFGKIENKVINIENGEQKNLSFEFDL